MYNVLPLGNAMTVVMDTKRMINFISVGILYLYKTKNMINVTVIYVTVIPSEI